MSEEASVGRTVSAMKKNGKLWVALIGLLAGIVLLLMGSFSEKNDTVDTAPLPEGESHAEMEAYRQTVEARVAALCARVEGAGKVTAAVTLSGGYEYVYATDGKDSAGGASTQYILIGHGSEERPVYLTRRAPTVAGIGVVCSGGDDPDVRREIVGLLSATFGVGSHKIYVTGGG